MSDEASSSAAAASHHPTHNDDELRAENASSPSAAEVAERREKNRQMFNKKRGELLDDLLRGLDILVYAELSAVYYMDCSFIRFLLRGFAHFVLLTPKPPITPEPSANRPKLGAIILVNLLCILSHAVFAAPSADEATRGYLHGGLAMDFIGQKGPTSKIHLLLLDFLVFCIQLVQLSAYVTRQQLKETSISVTTSAGLEYTPAAPAQDLDHEERGVLRADEQRELDFLMAHDPDTGMATGPVPAAAEASSEHEAEAMDPDSTVEAVDHEQGGILSDPDAAGEPFEHDAEAIDSDGTTEDFDHENVPVRHRNEQRGIEMQPLNPNGTTAAPSPVAAEPPSEHESLLAATASAPRTDAHIFDAFNSGQIVLADLDLRRTAREQFRVSQNFTYEQRDSDRAWRANITGQLLRWRFGGEVGRTTQTV